MLSLNQGGVPFSIKAAIAVGIGVETGITGLTSSYFSKEKWENLSNMFTLVEKEIPLVQVKGSIAILAEELDGLMLKLTHPCVENYNSRECLMAKFSEVHSKKMPY